MGIRRSGGRVARARTATTRKARSVTNDDIGTNQPVETNEYLLKRGVQ
jgi:hypothetical protein